MTLADLPISVRLALLTGTAFLLLLVVVGAVVYQALGAGLRSSLDRTLAVTSNGLHTRLDSDEDPDEDDADDRQEAVEETDGIAQMLDAEGRVLAASPAASSLPPLPDAEALTAVAAGRPQWDIVDSGRARLRFVATPAGRDVAVVAADTAPIAEAQRTLLATYGPAALLATTVAGLLGYGIARRGLAPITRMTAETEEIGHADLDRRLSLPPHKDEVRRLGETLNGMLNRLAGAVARERAFTADASHELRTPLAIVRAELELARRNATAQHVARSLDSALEEVDRLAALVDDLLVLARADAERLAGSHALDLGELASEVAQRFAPLANVRQVTLHVSGAAVAPGDARALRRAVANLLDNALRHTPSGGTVEVTIVPTEAGARITVADTGPGVDGHQLTRLFDRFTRADGARNQPGGAGLGLAIVAAVAAAHGGRVTAANRPEGGLAVTLDLGAGDAAASHAHDALHGAAQLRP